MRNPCYETYTTVEELISWHLECLDYFRESVRVGKYKGEDFLLTLQASRETLRDLLLWVGAVREYIRLYDGMKASQGKPDYMIWANALSNQEKTLRGMI